VTSLALADSDPTTVPADALVIGLYASDPDAAGTPLLAPGAEPVDGAFGGELAGTLALLGATGLAGTVTKLATLGKISAPVLAAVGLGVAPGADTGDGEAAGAVQPEKLAERWRRAAGAAVRALAGCDTVAVTLPLNLPGASADQPGGPTLLRGVAEGAGLGGYRFAGYASKPRPGERPAVRTARILVSDSRDKGARAEVRRASAVVEAAGRTRDWVNAAPNELRPPRFADEVARVAGRAGLDVEVLDEKALRKGGYGGILAVGDGSAAPPRLVRLAYAPKGRATRRVALVGKGITFDTGGLAIKPFQGMWEMKSDMSGAAAVTGAMLAIAATRPKVAVTAYLPMAENMISGTAYRPGDVVKMYSGTTVEVLNTDAEGRLVLADAIARACEDDPDYLFETSTLTGGQVTALGHRISGVMGTDELLERVRRAGDAVGEPMWPMPLPDETRASMRSDVADLLQCSAGLDRAAHMLQGGVFLSEFVADGVAWAHLDVAGPAYQSGEPYGYVASGATGIPLRTLLELVDDIAANG
jgi:leucyl aminopeptidase